MKIVEEAMYDLDGLRQICGNNPADIKEFIRLFIHTLKEAGEEIKEIQRGGEGITVSEVLHRVRPSVQIFGMKALYAEMRELEDAFRHEPTAAGSQERLDALFVALEQASGLLARDAQNFR